MIQDNHIKIISHLQKKSPMEKEGKYTRKKRIVCEEFERNKYELLRNAWTFIRNCNMVTNNTKKTVDKLNINADRRKTNLIE